MTDDYLGEPPLAGTDAEQLIGSLDRLRWTFRWKADGLDAAGLRTRIGSSALSLGGLLKHLAAVEDHVSTVRLDDAPMALPWRELGHDGSLTWEFTSAADNSPEELCELWDRAVGGARQRFAAAIAAGGLDQPVALSDDEGNHPSLRRLICDLVEEYGRHTGYADLLREEVDGLVGEDAPPDWRPGDTAGDRS